MNADGRQEKVFQSAGAELAVIDQGFEDLDDVQSNGDIPSTYKDYNFVNFFYNQVLIMERLLLKQFVILFPI